MSEFRERHNLGIELTPIDLTISGNELQHEGELSVDSNDDKLKTYLDGAERSVVTEDQVQTLTNKAIDADDNIISNLEVDNLKSEVLNTSTTMSGASDSQIPSALAIKTYVDNGLAQQNQASEISYDNTTSGLAATNVQAAIDELDSDIEQVATDLSSHINDTEDAHDASAISVTPTGNLAADDVQEALVELQTDVDTRTTNTAFNAHTSASSGVHGVTGSVVGTSDAQTLTNKTIDADLNTITNIKNADIKVGADIARSKLASGTNNAILVNNGSGVMSEMANASDSTNAIVLTSSKHIETQAVVDSTTTGSDASITAFNAGIVILTDSSLNSIANIPNGANGRHLTLINRTGNVLTIKDSVDALGTAANRVLTGTGASISLANNAGLELKYDSSVSRWQIIGGSGSGDGGISEWITAKAYAIGDIVYNGTGIYKALTNHTSTVFATDLAAGKWVEMSTTATVAIDDSFSIKDSFDPTKQLTFNVSGTTGTLTTFFTNQTANRLITFPDASDTVVVETLAQNLTNKTIVAANNTITTAASGNLVSTELNASLAELQGDINLLNTNPNYILNNEFSVNVNGWATYADAAGTSPVDGTGGSANVTFTRTTSTPLFGIASALLTKDAVNRQGQGFSYDFTIDEGMKTKVNTIRFDYQIASGTYATGDLTVWIYDVTNGALIQPAPYQIQNSGIIETFISEFQATTSLSYRLIVHISSTSASAYTVKFDNFYLGRAPKVYGSVVTGWELVTSGASVNWTNSTLTLYKRRVGDSVEYQGKIDFTGTPSGGGLRITLPHHYQARALNSGFNNNLGYLLDASASQDYTLFGGNTATNELSVYRVTNAPPIMGSYSSVTPTAPVTIASGDYISFKIDAMPVQGWSSSQQLSQDADTRVVSFSGHANSNQALTAFVTNINLVVGKDTHGAWTGNSYIVPVSGDYHVSCGITITTNFSTAVEVFINGVRSKRAAIFSASQTSSGSVLLPSLKAGDIISFRTSADITIAGNGSDYPISITRISGPSQIAASETVSASYYLSANFSASTTTPVNFDTKEFDSHNAVTVSPTAWRFTAPISGVYSVANLLYITSAACNFYIYKNGSSSKYIGYTDSVIGLRTINNTSIRLLAGEYLDVRPDASITVRGGALTTNVTAYITITRTGNY